MGQLEQCCHCNLMLRVDKVDKVLEEGCGLVTGPSLEKRLMRVVRRTF